MTLPILLRGLIILALVGFSPPLSNFRNLTPAQKAQADEILTNYLQTFSNFSNAQDKRHGLKKLLELHYMFQGLEYIHSNDLPDDLGLPAKLEVQHYFNLIANHYKYELEVEFEPLGVAQSETYKGTLFANFRVQKTMTFKGKKKSVVNVIKINMDHQPEPKINIIGTPDIFINKQNCSALVQKGDFHFERLEYQKAKQQYEESLDCSDNDKVAQKLSICIRKIVNEEHFHEFMEEGDRLFAMNSITMAKRAYEKALTIKPQDPDLLRKVSLCNSQIKITDEYKFFVSKGDSLFQNQYYQGAKDAYLKALDFKTRDNYAMRQVQQCAQKIQATNQKDQVSIADRAFAQGDFLKAKNLYQEILTNKQYPKKIELRRKIESCDKELLFAEFMKKGAGHFKRTYYQKAKFYFLEASKVKESDKRALLKVKQCETEINFEYYKKQGDYYMNEKKFFEKAQELYKRALEFKKEDEYVLRQIRICEKEINNPARIQKELETAISLWNRANTFSKNRTQNYRQCFEILDKYEDSGQFKGAHNFILGLLYQENYGNISKLAGINGNQGKARGLEYLYKSVRMGYDDAKTKFCLARPKLIRTLKLNLNCDDRY